MNELAEALSPYLRQHAGNPVAWRQWGPAALAEAERRDIPLLISIGYQFSGGGSILRAAMDPGDCLLAVPRSVAAS